MEWARRVSWEIALEFSWRGDRLHRVLEKLANVRAAVEERRFSAA
jgi:hypothetical protein